MRSGSSLLCDLLNNTLVMGNPREFLRPSYLKEHLSFEFKESDLNSSLIYLQLSRFATPNKVSGVKMMWVNFNYIIEQLKLSCSDTNTQDKDLIDQAFINPKWIFISRKDKLRQAISLARAIKTNTWKQETNSFAFKQLFLQTYISNFQIDSYLNSLIHDENKWFEFFKKNNITPYTVIYEDLCINYSNIVKEILEQLGEFNSDKQLSFSTNMKRQRDIYTEVLILKYNFVSFVKSIFPKWIVQIFSLLKAKFKHKLKTRTIF